MSNYNFDTNIEKRMPDTGKVFFVDRMTSDYAVAHPFDLDGYLEEVYNEFVGTEFEESREAMRRVWTAVLSVKSQRGDASLYPNKNGEKHPALIKVWGKAGDYWRRGFCIGDVLPAIVPGCKITRLDNGEWIALFPKDLHLLDAQPIPEHREVQSAEESDIKLESHEIVAVENGVSCRAEIEQISPNTTNEGENLNNLNKFEEFLGEADSPTPSEQNDAPAEEAPSVESVVEKKEPVQLDLFACSTSPTPSHSPRREPVGDERRTSFMEQEKERKRQQQEQANRAYARLYGSPAIALKRNRHSERNKKIFAIVATAIIFVVLLNTIGLFGIAAIGLIAGGIVK